MIKQNNSHNILNKNYNEEKNNMMLFLRILDFFHNCLNEEKFSWNEELETYFINAI